jgi:microcystin-dependent protein
MEQTSGPPLADAPALPTLAIAQLVATTGIYPIRGAEGTATNYQGMIQTFAGMKAFGAPPSQGQLLPIAPYTALFSLFGTFYGGDGKSTFAFPDLRSRTAVGGYPGEEGEQTLGLNYIIAATGPATGEPPLGSVGLFGGSFAPPGWVTCDGSLLNAADYPALEQVIGATFGGGEAEFAVPKLTGSAVYGAGRGPGLPPVTVGQTVQGAVPGLGLNYIICTQGMYPSSDGPGGFPTEPFLAQVIAFAGAEAPGGWALCDGALLPIADNQALYSLLGTTYGGDGLEKFALPDLRGRVTIGQ